MQPRTRMLSALTLGTGMAFGAAGNGRRYAEGRDVR
jgi:hypothetical protein